MAHTFAELHAALGTALERLAHIPAAHDRTKTAWTLGYQPADHAELELHLYRANRAELEAITTALGGSPDDITRTGPISHNQEQHEARWTIHGVPAVVTAWLPAPTDREQLLARLAELDNTTPENT